jgi:hypothetical protein
LFLPTLGNPRLGASLDPVRLLLLPFPTLSMLATIVTVVHRYYL